MSTDMESNRSKLEFWGGVECTINRIGDTYRDQLFYAGHYNRNDDIDRIADLGISHLRYPLLWERHQHGFDEEIDWSVSGHQLRKIKDNGITPIVGLLHHGSGPMFTSLVDPLFPEKFAQYARKVATRFPWLTHYIPINEPLTTARFSGLYGHWYPHHCSDRSFVKALLNQVMGIRLAIHEIRKINPAAVFIQTEDLARIYSSEKLQYQADFENERRWISFDLLCGRVSEKHPMWRYLLSGGASKRILEALLEDPCVPDLLGMNYYVTSERYLDDNIDSYSQELIGGNGIHRYVDIEACRAGISLDLGSLLREAHSRYKLPMAMTEVHLACDPDQQVRWFCEVWDTCNNLSKTIGIKAITAWSLLGAFDWNSLLTQTNMDYECGLFDVRGGNLKITEAGRALISFIKDGALPSNMTSVQGWWREEVQESILA